jgi:branched-subunit amino acid transport protein
MNEEIINFIKKHYGRALIRVGCMLAAIMVSNLFMTILGFSSRETRPVMMFAGLVAFAIAWKITMKGEE